jgi:hypothetical protein
MASSAIEANVDLRSGSVNCGMETGGGGLSREPRMTVVASGAGPSGRIRALDGLRGLLLIHMVFNHLLHWPFQDYARIAVYTYKPFGFVTAAEGFFFISGFIASIAYGSLYAKSSLSAVWAAVSRRVAKIYVINLTITLVLLRCIAAGFPAVAQQEYLADQVRQSSWLSFALPLVGLNVPWLCEILLGYVAYLLLVPVLLVAVNRGRMRTLVIIFGALWCCGQLYPMSVFANRVQRLAGWDTFLTFGFFDLFAWQILFVGAFLIGMAARRGELPGWVLSPPPRLIAACVATCTAFFIQRHFGWPCLSESLEPLVTTKVLAPLCLINFAAIALLLRAAWPFVAPIFEVRPLVVLGEGSLGVFAYHIIVVYLIAWAVFTPTWLVLGSAVAGMYPAAIVWVGFRKWRKRRGFKW